LAKRTFGSDVDITATRHVPARADASNSEGNATSLPSHCLVSGMINERAGAGGKTYGIGFELALPDQWNGRFLLQGGGGLNGSVRPPIGPVAAGNRPALARGFAVVSHDSGHKGAGFDDSFLADQRAALDFAETSVRLSPCCPRRSPARSMARQSCAVT
jgi:feruloyl esterase